MHTMHPVVLIGPGDWDTQQIPRAEFDARLQKFWAASGAPGAVVFGNPRDHAELAYLTHFTPKLEAAIALIPRNGAPKLFFGGGPTMIGGSRPLTWITDLVPIRDAAKVIGQWTADTGASPVLIGSDLMPEALRKAIERAAATPRDATAVLRAQMRQKSALELGLMKAACATLGEAMAALRAAWRSKQDAVSCILAAEQRAYDLGAQDVRSLFSLDGGRTLRPLAGLNGTAANPLQVYLAVRHDGYWAEAFDCISDERSEAAAIANDALDAAVAKVRPGMPARDVYEAARARIASAGGHPVTVGAAGHGIGLSLSDGPALTADSDAVVMEGDVYTLRAGVSGAAGHAIVSAVVAAGRDGCDVLWRAEAKR